VFGKGFFENIPIFLKIVPHLSLFCVPKGAFLRESALQRPASEKFGGKNQRNSRTWRDKMNAKGKRRLK
jgi:hypothetical protein